ncbi:MAG: hypothetical protein IJJ69_04070 [Oscillospiraceae bacterium]|nr:hypothetical protein [Oscillospiraceae bacterium]
MKPIMQCVREFIMTFPELKDGCLMLDYLGDKPVEYSVEPVPSERIYKKYTDGHVLKQQLFLFASRELYSADINQLIENSAFYEKFENWILHTALDNLSSFLDGRNAFAMEILTGNYLFDADYNSARYQIQLRLIYEEQEEL